MTARTRNMMAQIQRWLRRRFGTSDTYRPERHYMRGPGPKWLAKSGTANSASAKPTLEESKA